MQKHKQPHPTDIAVGARVRAQRLACGMSQTGLAEKLGVTFQQVQKYEKGSNRLSASRLQAVAKVFNLPVSHFFAENRTGAATPSEFNELVSFLSTARAVRLIRAFSKLNDSQLENSIVTLVESLADDKK